MLKIALPLISIPSQTLLNAGFIHHVADEHEFKDKMLFYRFTADDSAASKKAPKGASSFQLVSQESGGKTAVGAERAGATEQTHLCMHPIHVLTHLPTLQTSGLRLVKFRRGGDDLGFALVGWAQISEPLTVHQSLIPCSMSPAERLQAGLGAVSQQVQPCRPGTASPGRHASQGGPRESATATVTVLYFVRLQDSHSQPSHLKINGVDVTQSKFDDIMESICTCSGELELEVKADDRTDVHGAAACPPPPAASMPGQVHRASFTFLSRDTERIRLTEELQESPYDFSVPRDAVQLFRAEDQERLDNLHRVVNLPADLNQVKERAIGIMRARIGVYSVGLGRGKGGCLGAII